MTQEIQTQNQREAAVLAALNVGKVPMGCYLSVVQAQSKVRQKANFIRDGHFCAQSRVDDKDIIVRLGSDLRKGPDGKNHAFLKCIVGPFRPHAVHFVGGKATEKSYDIDDPVFKRIKNSYDAKLKITGEGFAYGPEIMMYIPPTEIFGEDGKCPEMYTDGLVGVFFFKGTSAKNAPCGSAFPAGTCIELATKFIEWNGNAWWNPQSVEIINDNEDINKWRSQAAAMFAEKAMAFANPMGAVEFVVTDADVDR